MIDEVGFFFADSLGPVSKTYPYKLKAIARGILGYTLAIVFSIARGIYWGISEKPSPGYTSKVTLRYTEHPALLFL